MALSPKTHGAAAMGGQDPAAEKINYRTCGTRAQQTGKIAKKKDSDSVSTTTPSIPSKLETVLYKGERESLGFNTGNLRFTESEDQFSSNPGPAAYSLPPEFGKLSNSDSFGKRGTGGFASVTKRFIPANRANVPGPGSYEQMWSNLQREDAFLKAPQANFQRPDSVSRFFVIGARIFPQLCG